MNEQKTVSNKEALPMIMGARDLQKIGFSRTMAYQLLNRSDMPLIILGGRKFLYRDRFFEWLECESAKGPVNR